MIHIFTQQFLKLVPLVLVVTGLLVYNFMSAQWQSPTAIAPNNNAEAPVNISANYQAKFGDLGAVRMRAGEYCNAAGTICFTADTVANIDLAANPVSVARNAGYTINPVPVGVTPEWPAAIICEQSDSPVVLYAHGLGNKPVDGFRYRDLTGNRRYDFNADGTYSGRNEVMSGCSRFATNGDLQGICDANLCMGAQ